MSRVKQHDIAARAGVSVSTVSRVLNNVNSISEEVRQRVLAAATELGYRSASSQPLKLRQVSLFTPLSRAIDLFHADILAALEVECLRQGIKLAVTGIDEGDNGRKFVLDKLKQTGADGILLLSVDDPALVKAVLELGLPVVTLNTDGLDLPVDTFLPDNYSGALRVMRHLTAQGHRRILHLTYLQRFTIRRRHQAYRAALEEVGVPYLPELVVDLNVEHQDAYTWLSNRLATGPADFSAIFCANDVFAIEVLRALPEAGYRVPEEMSVVGFDDISTVAFLTPPLTTVRIERQQLGRLALQRLLERAAQPQLTPIRVELWSELIPRQSVAAVSD